MSLPKHVVLIPDGNRRWAAERGKPAHFGHAAGAKSSADIFDAAYKSGINSISFWGCSVSNVTERGRVEVAFLYKLFESYFKKIAARPEIKKDQIRIRFLGRGKEFFPKSLLKVMHDIEQATAKYSNRNLTFLMAYDGRDEMQSAIKNIVDSRLASQKITKETIKQNLWTKDLPPVDLVIRTGGEPHWSAGLLMWDVAEAQLYFTKTFWPAFSPKEFQKALSLYAKTTRRHGK